MHLCITPDRMARAKRSRLIDGKLDNHLTVMFSRVADVEMTNEMILSGN